MFDLAIFVTLFLVAGAMVWFGFAIASIGHRPTPRRAMKARGAQAKADKPKRKWRQL